MPTARSDGVPFCPTIVRLTLSVRIGSILCGNRIDKSSIRQAWHGITKSSPVAMHPHDLVLAQNDKFPILRWLDRDHFGGGDQMLPARDMSVSGANNASKFLDIDAVISREIGPRVGNAGLRGNTECSEYWIGPRLLWRTYARRLA